MKKDIKKVHLLLLSAIIGISACSTPNADLQKQIDSLRETSITIPKSDRGALSGSVQFDTSNTIKGALPPETTVKVIRDEDIPERDANGKAVIDTKTKKEKLLERKGQVVGTAKVNTNGSFLVSNLRPGAAIVNISNKSSTNEVATTIVAGKVIELKNIDFGTAKSGKVSSLNITGQVLKADGTPVANAKVADVTGGFVGTFTNTNSEGDFTLPINPFSTARSLEISSGNLVTSIAVSPEQIENLKIPLIANSRTVKGTVFDAVNKEKTVPNVSVKVSGTNTSSVTDEKGNFILRGVPLNTTSLELGNIEGYNSARVTVPSATDSNDTLLQPVFMRPIGNLFVTIQPDYTRPYNGMGPFATNSPAHPFSVNDGGGKQTFYYSNNIVFTTPLTGSIQIEGTTIVQPFTIPATSTLQPAPQNFVNSLNSFDVKFFLPNQRISIPINNVPGGEYTLSISLPFHQTQKGIKVVIPSNDTIATEEIQLSVVQSVVTIGDVTGKVLIKDRNGNILPLDTGLQIRVKALASDIDLSGTIITGTGVDAVTSSPVQAELSANAFIAEQNGVYTIPNVKTGTAILLAAVFNEDGTLNSNYLPATYTLLNVIGGTINKAPEISIIKR